MPGQLDEKTLLLPLSHPPKYPHIPTSPSSPGPTKTTKRVAALAALIALVHVSVLWFCADSGPRAIFFSQDSPDAVVEGGGYEVGLPDKITHRWGQYAPWFPAGDYTPPPDGCIIDQVNILQRHGARHPNEDDDYAKAVSRLQRAERYTSKKLEFLKDYEYTLGEANLIPLGAQQSWEAGVQAWRRYAETLGLEDGKADEGVFVRASGMPRVVDSAKNWSAGFLSPHHLTSLAPPTLPLQILSEDTNNTLNDECPGAPSPDPYTNAWLHKFAPPILYRLLSMAQGVRLEEEDVRRLIGMCVFESIAMAGETHGKEKAKSKFCDLFTYRDWKEWEYWGDIEKYYKTGYGNSLGPVQGAGYANELLARLTHSPVRDNTTHNASLPFPLDKRLYVDFTHENLMVAVYSAMGLFRVGKLDPEHRPEDAASRISGVGGLEREAKTKWRASKMVPFSSRMVVERLRCPALTDGAAEGSDDQFVRIFVNDALQPLEFCRADHSSSTSSPTAINTSDPPEPHQTKNRRAKWLAKHSLCTLPAFVESQSYAREHAGKDFLKCWN